MVNGTAGAAVGTDGGVGGVAGAGGVGCPACLEEIFAGRGQGEFPGKAVGGRRGCRVGLVVGADKAGDGGRRRPSANGGDFGGVI